jgi:hypothetical protein
MRIVLTFSLLALTAISSFAQTQPTRPSASATTSTMSSADATSALSPCYSSTNRTSPCYSGTIYPSYSAITPVGSSSNPKAEPGSDFLNENQVKARIVAKGYSDVSELYKDDRGIWRGKAIMKDGRPVAVILDLEGDIYSKP